MRIDMKLKIYGPLQTGARPQEPVGTLVKKIKSKYFLRPDHVYVTDNKTAEVDRVIMRKNCEDYVMLLEIKCSTASDAEKLIQSLTTEKDWALQEGK